MPARKQEAPKTITAPQKISFVRFDCQGEGVGLELSIAGTLASLAGLAVDMILRTLLNVGRSTVHQAMSTVSNWIVFAVMP